MPVDTTPSVAVRAPAKVNLGLSVGRKGRDGFHPLATLFQAVSLYDDLTAEEPGDDTITLTMEGEDTDGLPCDETNLAVRAALLLRDQAGRGDEGAILHIRKGIPVAGGMAGGSADAAAALVACSVLWDLDIDPDELALLGARLGSDVPFCVLGGNAIGTGRGDHLTAALGRGQFHWVFALAHEGLSTPSVYNRFDELGLGVRRPEVREPLLRALATGDARALGSALRNDLQPAAVDLRPDLGRVLEAGRDLGALGGVVSGSGPTVALLAASEEKAIDLSVALSAEGLCRTVRRAHGPVPGARALS